MFILYQMKAQRCPTSSVYMYIIMCVCVCVCLCGCICVVLYASTCLSVMILVPFALMQKDTLFVPICMLTRNEILETLSGEIYKVYSALKVHYGFISGRSRTSLVQRVGFLRAVTIKPLVSMKAVRSHIKRSTSESYRCTKLACVHINQPRDLPFALDNETCKIRKKLYES